MIILSATSDAIQVALSASHTVTPLRCVSCFRDITTTAYTPGRHVVDTNGMLDVDLVPAPAASTQRVVDYIGVFNSDTTSKVVTIKFDANGTEYVLWKGTLLAGERVQYTDASGFKVYDTNGLEKATAVAAGASYVAGAISIVSINADVVNNNASANTLQDVTGLQFPVIAGETYWFKFVIPYTSAATTTGSRWTINGPGSPTLLAYGSRSPLTATTESVNGGLNAYDLPAAASASSLAAGGVAHVEGIIRPSSNGNVVARFASEIASSAITAKAGATVLYGRVL